MADIRKIGENIRRLREEMGLTQNALAEKLLVSFQAISSWERGMSVPELENAVRLAELFNISLDDLLADKNCELYVGIDGGGSKTELVLLESNGTVRDVVFVEGSNPNDTGVEKSLAVLTKGLETLLKQQRPAAIFGGIAGASAGDHSATIAKHLRERFRAKVYIDTDAVNILSCGEDPADVGALICGTGSCVFIRKGEKRYRIGGWGYLFDQAGSAYDVGKDAFRCALAAEDGLTEENLLSRRVREAVGGNVFANIPTVYKKGRPYIATFAKIVVAAAEEGDETSMDILSSNAARLAQLIQTGIARYGKPSQFVAGGGFLKSELFCKMVEEAAGVELVIPELPPVYGACVEVLCRENIEICKEFRENFLDSYRRVLC